MSSYTTIDGKKLNSMMIDKATQLVKGGGDGRISLKDAEVLMTLVKADNILTNAEKDTLEYIYKNYLWTDHAEEWFRKELKDWQPNKAPIPMTVAELSKMHFSKMDVFADPDSRAHRKLMLVTATAETNVDHDEIVLWIRLADGTTAEVFVNFIELEDEFVELRGGCMVPVRAIEKVEI